MQGITAAFMTGLGNISSNVMGIIVSLIPIALVIAGAIFVVKKGISWFMMSAK